MDDKFKKQLDIDLTEAGADCKRNGLDTIYRQDAIDAIDNDIMGGLNYERILKELPSAEPEIIYCKDCRKHNMGINEAPYIVDRCPLILYRGYAKGHEFDYQFCAFAARRKENG